MRKLLVIVVLTLSACAPQEVSRGAALYADYCAVCHGEQGRGDGPVGAELPLAPADLGVLSRSNDGVFPRGRVMAKVYGYPGRFEFMPEFSAVFAGPVVIWKDDTGETSETPRALLDLAGYLEAIQQN